MARDKSALTIQGPDNGSGNPIAVTGAGGGGTVSTDLETVRTNIVRQDLVGGFTVAIGDPLANILYLVGTTSSADPALQVTQVPSFAGTITSGANAAVSFTAVPIATNKVTLSFLAIQFDGANAATTLQVFDGATMILNFFVPAATNIPWMLAIPNGGFSGNTGNTMTVTLGAGGVGVHGIINVAFLLRNQ